MATETLRPNAAGDNSELAVFGDTPNWKCVDEETSDADTTYVRSSSADDLEYLDLYNIGASAIPAGSTINSATVYVLIRNISPTYPANFWVALKESGGATQTAQVTDPGVTYTLKSAAFAGVTQPDLDALQIGVKIASSYDDVFETYRSGRCTQVYIVVDYTEAAAGQPYASRVQQVSGMRTFNPIHMFKPKVRRIPW